MWNFTQVHAHESYIGLLGTAAEDAELTGREVTADWDILLVGISSRPIPELASSGSSLSKDE